MWSATEGVRKWIVILGLMTAGIGIMEALLFQFMGKVVGKVVDWLGKYTPDTLFAEKGWQLAAMAAMMVFGVLWTFLTSTCVCRLCRACSPCACAGISTA